jgi:hypothetical protein
MSADRARTQITISVCSARSLVVVSTLVAARQAPDDVSSCCRWKSWRRSVTSDSGAQGYVVSGALNTPFNVPVVGTLVPSFTGTDTFIMAELDETGLEFHSSLVITAAVATQTAYIATAYKLTQ